MPAFDLSAYHLSDLMVQFNEWQADACELKAPGGNNSLPLLFAVAESVKDARVMRMESRSMKEGAPHAATIYFYYIDHQGVCLTLSGICSRERLRQDLQSSHRQDQVVHFEDEPATLPGNAVFDHEIARMRLAWHAHLARCQAQCLDAGTPPARGGFRALRF